MLHSCVHQYSRHLTCVYVSYKLNTNLCVVVVQNLNKIYGPYCFIFLSFIRLWALSWRRECLLVVGQWIWLLQRLVLQCVIMHNYERWLFWNLMVLLWQGKKRGRWVCHENLRSREGFHRVCSHDDSSSSYVSLIGWYSCLIQVLVYDWLKRTQNLGR